MRRSWPALGRSATGEQNVLIKGRGRDLVIFRALSIVY